MSMFLSMGAYNLENPLHCPLQKLPPPPPHTVVDVAAADDGNYDERRRVPPHHLPHRPMTPACKNFVTVLFVVSTVVVLGVIARMVVVDNTSWGEALLMLPVVLLVMAIIVVIQATPCHGPT
uniref:Transmembrane protein n=1 Tax=Oryza glumipatula TaxID=40148 RepID=A0A0E0AGB7_9ORYZ